MKRVSQGSSDANTAQPRRTIRRDNRGMVGVGQRGNPFNGSLYNVVLPSCSSIARQPHILINGRGIVHQESLVVDERFQLRGGATVVPVSENRTENRCPMARDECAICRKTKN